MPRGPNLARIIETGAILGVLVTILALTGLLLSPTFLAAFGGSVDPGFGNFLFVTHMACAVLLTVFTGWHLWPYAYAFTKKAGRSIAHHALAYLLLAFILFQIVSGYVLYTHDYRLLPKEWAVYTHLAVTFLILIPITPHAYSGFMTWRTRRAARVTATTAATLVGREQEALAAEQRYTRRVFVRLTAYAIAGVALATWFGRFISNEVKAWRLNSIGAIPPLTKETWRLRITGNVARPVEITFNDLLKLDPETIRFTHHCVEGWSYTDEWTGVKLRRILELSGGVTNTGKMLIFKSPEVSTRMRTRGQRYTTNFPYRDDLLDKVYVVYQVGGQDMPPAHGGPVRLMSPHKWGYKACKWLTEIEASADTSYRGYWERAGYHNVGDYPGPIFG